MRGDEAHVASVQADLVAEFGLRRVAKPVDATRLTVCELIVLGRYRLLHSAITWAMHEQYLRFDPLAGHRAPRAPLPRKHLRPALGRRLIEEADRLAQKAQAAYGERPGSRRLLLAAFRAEQTALLVRLVADTGARLGELAAMQVGDLEDGRLTMERAAKGRGVVGPTKTHRRRAITLGPAVATRWVAHVDTWRPDAAEAWWLFTSTPESDQALGLSGMSLRFRRVRGLRLTSRHTSAG